MIYKRDDKLDSAGAAVLKSWHTNLKDFVIRFVFREPPGSVNGSSVLVRSYKPGAKERWLWGKAFDEQPDGLVEVAEAEYLALSPDTRKATLDHAVARFDVVELKKGGTRLRLRNPDVSEFGEVIARQGAYTPQLADFFKRAKQAKLFEKVA